MTMPRYLNMFIMNFKRFPTWLSFEMKIVFGIKPVVEWNLQTWPWILQCRRSKLWHNRNSQHQRVFPENQNPTFSNAIESNMTIFWCKPPIVKIGLCLPNALTIFYQIKITYFYNLSVNVTILITSSGFQCICELYFNLESSFMVITHNQLLVKFEEDCWDHLFMIVRGEISKMNPVCWMSATRRNIRDII